MRRSCVRRKSFYQCNFSARRLDSANFHVVHESSHQKQSAPGVPQQIIVVQRVRHFFQFETFAPIRDPDRKRVVHSRYADMNLLVPVVAVAVNDRIHHTLPDGHSNSVLLVLVETSFSSRLEDLDFGLVNAFKSGRVVLVKKFFYAGIHVFQSNRSG